MITQKIDTGRKSKVTYSHGCEEEEEEEDDDDNEEEEKEEEERLIKIYFNKEINTSLPWGVLGLQVELKACLSIWV